MKKLKHDSDNCLVENVSSFKEITDRLEKRFKEEVNVTTDGEVKGKGGTYFGCFCGVSEGGLIEFPTAYDYAGASDKMINEQFHVFDKTI